MQTTENSTHPKRSLTNFSVGLGASPALCLAAIALAILAIFLGGGTRQGLWSDALVQLVSLIILVVLVADLSRQVTWRADPWPLLLLAAIVVLPLIQLISLPPTLWTALPGRAQIAEAYIEVGMPLPWLPISLDASATWRALLSLLPPACMFLIALRLDRVARRTISAVFIALAITSVLLGLAQLMQGPASPLRFFPITNPNDSVGFFANRNHYAAFLYVLVPVTAAWIVGLVYDRRPERLFGLVVCLLVFAALLLGLGMARSRAGFLLAVVAALASGLIAAINQRRMATGRGLAVIAGAGFLGGMLIIQFAFFRLLQRLDDGILTDFRVRIAEVTSTAASAFQPVGSGFGSFETVYQMFEPPEALLPSYVNHAHNDWLELWLEGGWLGVTIAALFLIWFGRAAINAWRPSNPSESILDRALAQAATIAIVLLLLHSAMDYPLRTTALATFFAWCCGLLVKPVAELDGPAIAANISRSDARPRQSRRRHHRRHARRAP